MHWGWWDCLVFWDVFSSGGFASDSIVVIFEVELLKLLVWRELLKVLVVRLILGGNDADQLGELLLHEEPDPSHVGINAQHDLGFRVEVVADEFFFVLGVLGKADLRKDLF